MKCPKCSYEQAIYDDLNEWWYCPQCHGTGEVQMTNEEWLRIVTFEEMAGAIYEWHTKGYAKGRLEAELNPITDVVDWLKQPHREE